MEIKKIYYFPDLRKSEGHGTNVRRDRQTDPTVNETPWEGNGPHNK